MTDININTIRIMLDIYEKKINLESTYTVQHLKDILSEAYREANLNIDWGGNNECMKDVESLYEYDET